MIRQSFSTNAVSSPLVRGFAQRRKLWEEHERKWLDAGKVAKAIYELPDEIPPGRFFTQIINGNLVAFRNVRNDYDGLNFLHLPPVTDQADQGPVERWSIPPFTFKFAAFIVYAPDSVLAIAERGGR